MSKKDIEKVKQFLEEKKKENLTKRDNKLGNGKVEKNNKNIGIGSERTKKIF